jgi:hypothetical protein
MCGYTAGKSHCKPLLIFPAHIMSTDLQPVHTSQSKLNLVWYVTLVPEKW